MVTVKLNIHGYCLSYVKWVTRNLIFQGYDMEDAMILNKSSFERGFGHGSVYKSEFIDLKEISKERNRISLMFGCKPGDTQTEGKLDKDGLPPVGKYLTEGEPYYRQVSCSMHIIAC